MSNTRKTRPLAIRMADPKDHGVNYEEFHDHTDGKECDLPSTIVDQFKTNVRPNCYFHFKYVGKNVCGCPMCTNHFGRKWDLRKARHSVPKIIKDQLKDLD